MRLVAKLPIIWELLMGKTNNKRWIRKQENIGPRCIILLFTLQAFLCKIKASVLIHSRHNECITSWCNLSWTFWWWPLSPWRLCAVWAWQRGNSTNSAASDTQRPTVLKCTSQPHTCIHISKKLDNMQYKHIRQWATTESKRCMQMSSHTNLHTSAVLDIWGAGSHSQTEKQKSNPNNRLHTHSHTDSLVRFFAVLLDFAYSHYTSTYQKNRY